MREQFDYDLWANTKWLKCLEGKGWPEPERQIFAHILAAQQGWLSRCQGTSPSAPPDVPLTLSALAMLNAEWKEVLGNTKDNPVVAYRRYNGEAYESRFEDIVRHVINHSTYHRGELRGLCRAREDDDFPETDFIGFALEKGRDRLAT